MLGQADNFIGKPFDVFIGLYIRLSPAPCLIPAGNNKDKAYILMG